MNVLCNPFGKHIRDYPTYREAVIAGQREFGYGHFWVDTGGRTPTREEQLLITKRENKRADRRKKLLAGL